ncbi:MAG: hypothetical protein IT430_08205 [Phycisphaerales bacterium]|nr:hypothetical protein [Phycisphaerales bacterium]
MAIGITMNCPAHAQEYRYALFQLPSQNESLGVDASGGLNAAGDVVGSAPNESFWNPRAVLWPLDGGVIDLGTLGGDLAGATAINDRGEIVGSSGFKPGGSYFKRRAFVWRDGEMTDRGTLGGETSVAYQINNSGVIVGESEFEFGNSASVGFVWSAGQMRELDDPWPDRNATDVWGINDDGKIVGKGLNAQGFQRAMIWVNEVPSDLGSLAGGESVAYAINELGDVVGRSATANGRDHAVIWIDQQIIDIHDEQYGPYSWGDDINNQRQVIGSIGNHIASRRMFIWEPGQPMRLLKHLIPPRTRLNWRLDRGRINDVGQICSTAEPDGNPGATFALLLTRVDPSMSLAAPLPGTAGTANTTTVSNARPGARVIFLYSRHGGGTRIPGCDLQQNALQLDQPTIIGSAIADQNGVASITRTVPLIARGQTILFQAAVQNECAISQLVVWRFE